MKLFQIVELTPDSNGCDDVRVVEIFDRKEDAQLVLDTLERVNVDFNTYRLKEVNVDY